MNSLLDNLVKNIVAQIKPICEQLETLPIPELVEALNQIRQELHKISPFDDPVDLVLWVKGESVEGNDYNPNSVAPPEMRLLKRSINRNGYTQPAVTYPVNDGRLEVIDGEHRTRIGKEDKKTRERLYGYLPVTIIRPGQRGQKDRIAATIDHNRARGIHGVIPMTDIVTKLIRLGWGDDEVALELGMDADEILRFKHNSGLAELFKEHEYSKAWE